MDALPRAQRPHFIPAGVDFDSLPSELQVAIETLLDPLYESLVLDVVKPLERSAGTTVVFLYFLELLEQYELGHYLQLVGQADEEAKSKREKDIARYLKLTSAKQKNTDLLLRLQKHLDRKKSDRKSADEQQDS